jgi:mRNA interferase RelE/StbE
VSPPEDAELPQRAELAKQPTYTIGYEASAAKELSKLDKPVDRRISKAVQKLANDPQPPGSRPLVGYETLWRIRVGDYRVIYTIANNDLIVLVVRIAHRSVVYRAM